MADEQNTIQLSEEDVIIIVWRRVKGGKVLRAVVLQCFMEDKNRQIVRWDTAHGGLHRDELYLPKNKRKKDTAEFEGVNPKIALTQILDELKDSERREGWKKLYRKNILQKEGEGNAVF